MPCYTPPPTPEEEAEWARMAAKRGDWEDWYKLLPRITIEQWLCDALRGNTPHPDCIRWWKMHKEKETKK